MAQTSDSEGMDFETVLNGELGEMGKYQVINICLLFVPAMFSGFMAGEYIFTAAKLPHRCAIPMCDEPVPIYAPGWIYNAIPATTSGFQDCARYTYNTSTAIVSNNTCPAEMFDKTTIPCEGYVYEQTNSIVYDFGLECNEWLRALVGTLNSLGAMIALPVAGFISDHYGRRVSIPLFAFNMALAGVLRALSVNFPMYATLQFLQVALGGGVYSAAYILATELVGSKYRVPASATMSSMFALGQVLLGTIAFGVREWRNLTLTLFSPAFLIVSYYWYITESHRWLLTKNKTDEAISTLKTGARLNGREISRKSLDFLLTAIPKESKNDPNGSWLFIRVLKSPVMLRRCCTTPIYWIAQTFIYYGLSINSVGLAGNMYLNYILTAFVEIPGYWAAVLLLDRIGRKVTLFYGLLLCAACCFAFSFTPKSLYIVSLSLYLTGKFSIGLTFTSLYLYTSELYPTRHRHSFLSYSSMVGRIGSVVAPLTPPLMVYWSGIPSMLFGVMAITAALLVLTQPETRGLKVPDTFEESEELGKCRN